MFPSCCPGLSRSPWRPAVHRRASSQSGLIPTPFQKCALRQLGAERARKRPSWRRRPASVNSKGALSQYLTCDRVVTLAATIGLPHSPQLFDALHGHSHFDHKALAYAQGAASKGYGVHEPVHVKALRKRLGLTTGSLPTAIVFPWKRCEVESKAEASPIARRRRYYA